VPHIDEVVYNDQLISKPYKHIAVAIDFSNVDRKSIATALHLGGNDANYTIIHVVETAGALVYGNQIDDYETSSDAGYLRDYKQKIEEKGYRVSIKLGFGNPKKQISKVVNEGAFDILIMGAHGHNWMKDILLGTTVDAVRHKVNIPVMIVRE
jgi:manganese transport protein